MTATVESAPFSAETSAEVVLRDSALYSSVLCSTAGLGIGILKNASFKLSWLVLSPGLRYWE